MSLKQIYEGWKNHLLPEENEKAFIEHVSQERLAICNACEEHSFNKKDNKSLRPDAHCVECGCTLSAKTKCLTCECPLKKWIAQSLPDEHTT
jgi:hydrogenase maturation factor HypF (carbamoyltransferase family)